MKITSWNIDGFKATLVNKSERGQASNEVLSSLVKGHSDVIALSEIKLSSSAAHSLAPYRMEDYPLEKKVKEDIDLIKGDYKFAYRLSTKRKGYAGVAFLYKGTPEVHFPNLADFNEDLSSIDDEGRLIALEYNDRFLINVYTPNSGKTRLKERLLWDEAFRNYITSLTKPVVIMGDLNVAHGPLDLKNPTGNVHKAGYTIEERESFTKLLDCASLIDVYRYLNPDGIGDYTWWTQLTKKAKLNNSGWRLDYFLATKARWTHFNYRVIDTGPRGDHAPIELIIKENLL